MGNNAIIGIEDINAQNSVPSKKYVQDEDGKLNTKISKNSSDISNLKSYPRFSHFSYFLYQNPVANVYRGPFIFPAGFLSPKIPLSSFLNDKTKITLHFLSCDNDTTLSSSSVIFSVEGIFYSKTRGFNSKVFVSRKEIISYRNGGNNDFHFGDDLSFLMKNFHSSWNSWVSFN